MDKPKVSICCSAIRTKDWQRFYDSVRNTEVPFEVVFVGPTSPENKMPENFRFIKSNTKPAQCYHISYLKAQGEILFSTSDDAEYGDHAIDKVYDFMKKDGNRLLMSGFTQFEDGQDTTDVHHYRNHLGERLDASPFPTFWRDTYFNLGGADNRFITGQWENDFSFRLLNAGGTIKLCRDAEIFVHHRRNHEHSGKFREYWQRDTDFLREQWFNSQMYFQKEPVWGLQPYHSDMLLEVSQGNKGEWQ